MPLPGHDDPVQAWNAFAPGWDRHHEELARHGLPVTHRIMELADVGQGEEVLELAAGLGDLSRQLARRVGRTGRVICSDASPNMLGAARRRAESTSPLRLPGARCTPAQPPERLRRRDRVQDGLDAAARPATGGLRVLRPGGRLVAATWGPLEHNPWITTFGAAMLTHGHAPPADPTGPGGMFFPGQALVTHAR